MADTNLVAKIILRLQDEASRGLGKARQNVSDIGQEMARVKQIAIGWLSFEAIKSGLGTLTGLSDKFANLTARIKLATSSEQEFSTAQGELFNIAQRTRSALDTVVGLYAKVQIGVKALGGTQKQAFDTTEAVTQAFKISGASASESAGGIQQLTQALASGVLRGEEFNSIMENGSRVAQALADGLGVPVAALRGMAEAGELTAERVINALLSQKDKLAAEYATLPQTVQDAWQQLENQFLRYIGKSKEAKEATKSIADGIGFVTNHLDTFINVAIKSGEVIAGIFVARKFAGLFAFTQGLIAARSEVKAAEIAALAAAANAQRAAAATAASVEVAALASAKAIADGATVAEAAVISAAAAGEAASRAAIAAGATVAESASIASAAAKAASEATIAANEVSLAATLEMTEARIAEATATQSTIVLAREEATAKLAATNASIAQARATIAALEATVQSTSVTYLLNAATNELAASELRRSGILSDLALLGQQNVRITAELIAAQEAQVLATEAQQGATIRLAETAALAGGAMSKLATAGKGAMALVGGPVGVAVIALYALYEVLKKVTGSEEKAAEKAKAHTDALALMNAEVKKLSAVEVDLDFAKTEHNIDVINEKIKGLEKFSFGKLFDLVDLSAQRANLLQTLDILKQKKEALVAQKNDKIMNFDASALSAAELNAELIDTKARIDEIHQRVDPLKKQLDDGLIGSEAVNADLALLQAYESKFEKLSKQSGDSAFEVYQLRQSLNTIPEAANAVASGIDTALSRAKTSAKTHAEEMVKPYDDAAKTITQGFEDSTQVIDTELKRQLENIKLNAANEEVEIDATAQAFRNAEAEKTAAVENTKTELERVWSETYGTAIELTRTAGGDIEQLERDGAQARIETLQTVVGAYESSISSMIDEEHRLLGEIKKTDEYRLNIQNSIEDKIRASQRKTLSDEAAYADEHNQIYEKLAQADSLRQHGELEAARKTAEEALRLADAHDRVLKDTSDNAVKRAMEAEAKAKASVDKINEYAVAGGNAHAKRVSDAADKVAEAHEKVIEAQQKQAEEQAENERRNIETATAYQKILESLDATAARLREKQQGAREGILGDIDGTKSKLASVKAALEGVFDQVSKKRDVKLKLDAESALKEVGKIDALLAAKDLSLKIKADPEGTDKEVAALNKILKDANISVPAVVAFEEIKKDELDKKVTQPIADAISKEQPIKISTDEAIKKVATVGNAVNAAAQPRTLTILTAEAEAEMNRVLAEIAKTKDPQQLNVDTAESLSKVSALTQQIASIPKNTITRLDADGNPISTTIIKTKDELEGLSRQNTITRLDADGRPLSTKVIGAKEELDGLKNTAPIVIDADVEKARAKTDALKVELIEKYQGMIAELSKKFDSMKAVSPDVDTEKAKGQIEEFSAKADDLLKAVDLGLNTTTASTELDRLKADVDAKLSAPTEAIHKVNPDFAAVFNDINAIKQNTSSTHTVYVNKVENNATGGLIQHLATGGRVAAQTFRRVVGAIKGPGTGTSDDVPVMASNGEFVVKTEAVQHYGVNFMNALNNKQLPVAPGYAIGGTIGDVGAPVSTAMHSTTAPEETINLNFNFGPKTLTLQAHRSLARELAVELRNAARVS